MAATGARSKTAVTKPAGNGNLENDIQQLRDDVARLFDDLKSMGGHSRQVAKKAADDGVEQLRAQSGKAVDTVRESAQSLERELTQTIRERPIATLALAAGAGFLLALVSRR